MARYLSPGWFEDVNATAPGPEPSAPAVTIQQVVVGGPEGDVRYWVRIGPDGGVATGTGEADGADATVTQSWPTAVALQRGELDVEAALVAGRIRFSGDVALLLEHQAALLAVAGRLDPVRRRTSYV